MDALVSIIILNYNHIELTLKLLNSLKKLSYQNTEIIVVDNGSEENIFPIISSKYQEVKYVKSNKNLGYAGGNNLGIKNSKGAYVLILNNDTHVEKDLVNQLLLPLLDDDTVGIVSPKIKFSDALNLIQYAGYNKINSWTGRNRAIGSRQIDTGKFDQLRETYYAHGAAMMFKRCLIDKVGLLPEKYFLYYEEIEYSQSVRNAGYKIIFQPKGVVHHKESRTIGKNNPIKTYYLNRSRILFMRRNYGVLSNIMFTVSFIFLSLPKNSLKYLLSGRLADLKAFYKAIFWNLTHSKY